MKTIKKKQRKLIAVSSQKKTRMSNTNRVATEVKRTSMNTRGIERMNNTSVLGSENLWIIH